MSPPAHYNPLPMFGLTEDSWLTIRSRLASRRYRSRVKVRITPGSMVPMPHEQRRQFVDFLMSNGLQQRDIRPPRSDAGD